MVNYVKVKLSYHNNKSKKKKNKMDLINILLFCLMSLIIGAVLMLVVQYYAFVKFLNLPEDDERRKSLEERYNLPEVRLIF